jgi:hypothetical protein
MEVAGLWDKQRPASRYAASPPEIFAAETRQLLPMRNNEPVFTPWRTFEAMTVLNPGKLKIGAKTVISRGGTESA